MAWFPKRLRELRKEKGWSQEELGRMINVTKVSVSGYENGNRTPDTETLQKIADVFGVSVDYLLGRTDEPTPSKHAIEEITQSLIERGIAEQIDGLRLIPVVGSIHAGEPIPPVDEMCLEPYPANALNPHKQYVFLRVKGDCMAGGPNPIHDGYKVLVEITPEANNYDVVAVFLPGEDEAVLRRIRYYGEGVILTADNPRYDPVVVRGKDVRIYGRVVRVEFEPAAAKEVRNHIHMEE